MLLRVRRYFTGVSGAHTLSLSRRRTRSTCLAPGLFWKLIPTRNKECHHGRYRRNQNLSGNEISSDVHYILYLVTRDAHGSRGTRSGIPPRRGGDFSDYFFHRKELRRSAQWSLDYHEYIIVTSIPTRFVFHTVETREYNLKISKLMLHVQRSGISVSDMQNFFFSRI